MPLHRRRTSRRSLLSAGARAGVGALGLALVGCADRPAGEVTGTPALGAGESPGWFKDTAPFIVHDDGKSLEARLELMRGLITPQRLFFVRNNSVSLDVDAAHWRLSVEGDAVQRPRELSYADLLNMPSRTLVSYLECAGNQRAMFDIVKGEAAGGTQWGTGGIGNGVWTGVSLWDVLAAAGVREDAASVLLIGHDTESPEQGFRRVLPIEKARHPDTLLAYALNGEALPRDHGYPLRALVPGWVGSSSIKWLSRIVVSAEPLWTRNNTTSYVLIGDDYPPEGEALGTVVAGAVDQERPGPALAGDAGGRLTADPRLRPIAARPDHARRVERRRRGDLARRGRARPPAAVLLGALRVHLGGPARRARRHDARHRRVGHEAAR